MVVLDDARAALARLSLGLDYLDDGLGQLKRRRSGEVVTATASQAIVARWLLPHLNDFAARHPDIIVRLDVTDRIVDLLHGEADIGIRCGNGNWPGLNAMHLHDEEIIVVCHPSMLPSGRTVDINWLTRQALLHDTTPASLGVFPNWQDWAERNGCDRADFDRGVRINASAAVLQAALSGHGVALARRALVAQDIDQGRLVQLFQDQVWPIAWSYFAVATPQALNRPQVAAFRDWLAEAWCAKSAI